MGLQGGVYFCQYRCLRYGLKYGVTVDLAIWLIKRYTSNWMTHVARSAGSQSFIARHKIQIVSKDGQETRLDHKRIRATYVTMREMLGWTEFDLQSDLGHTDVDTTSAHYMSDATSITLMDKRTLPLLNRFVADMIGVKPGEESPTMASLRAAIIASRDDAARKEAIEKVAAQTGMDEEAIIHLISPHGQTYITACKDARNPTWPGHEQFVRDRQCRFFDKCCQCSQAVVFPEALPYIARRIMDLDDLRTRFNLIEWGAAFGNERNAWQEIMDRWSNRTQVAEAWQRAESGEIVLPLLMKGA